MTRRQKALIAAVAVIAVAAVLLLLSRDSGPEGGETAGGEEAAAGASGDPAGAETRTAELYFPGGGGGLHREAREIPLQDSVEEEIAALVGALIAGPADDRLRAPLPADVTVREVYLVREPAAGNGAAAGVTTVYLDLESPEGRPPPASGSHQELLTVFSLVNTVLLNVEQADRVVLLWNGRQPVTFAGHLNTARPLAAERSLIASSP